jgi:flagellum-specific peptidoglycan hydrolase FlgJ
MKNPARAAWIKKYYLDAVKATAGTGIFPETLLAQAIVESQKNNAQGWPEPGLSLNAKRANNYFGIKKYPKWKGKTVDLPTPGDAQKISTFVVYDSVLDSFSGYVNFLKVNPRYGKALKATSYPEQIALIAAAGYAEGSNYKEIVTGIANSIKEYASKVKDFAQASETATKNSKNLFPLIFAGFIIAAAIIIKNAKKTKK